MELEKAVGFMAICAGILLVTIAVVFGAELFCSSPSVKDVESERPILINDKVFRCYEVVTQ